MFFIAARQQQQQQKETRRYLPLALTQIHPHSCRFDKFLSQHDKEKERELINVASNMLPRRQAKSLKSKIK